MEVVRERDEVYENSVNTAINNQPVKAIENNLRWNHTLEATLWTILILSREYPKRKQEAIEEWEQIRKNRFRHLNLRGGGREIERKPQNKLSNLTTEYTNSSYDSSYNEQKYNSENVENKEGSENDMELDFVQLLAPNINVDADECGNILFRRNAYGLMITRHELTKCIKLVTEQWTMADIYQEIKVQALYNSTDAEMRGTDGLGFCSILAIVSTLNPQLNSTDAMNNTKQREEIANSIENILIPAVREYIQPEDFRINTRAHEHEVYKDHTMEHLTDMMTLIRNTTNTYVEQDQWMYVVEVGIVI